MSRAVLAVVIAILVTSNPSAAEANCGTDPDVLIVLDRSGSMQSNSKWRDAKAAINQLTQSFAAQIRFGLMLFPGAGSSCATGQVQVPVGPSQGGAITSQLNSTGPSGSTPMGASLTAAQTYLTGVDPGRAKYVVLITDGQANCGQSPTGPVSALAAAGIKTYVVGFGSGVNPTQLNQLATLGQTARAGATKYYQAGSPAQLTQALQAIGSAVSCCGNGIVDSGELCDSAIPAGSNGGCPTQAQCDDNDACTIDGVAGAACAVTCTHTPITQAIHGDGCCPAGATALQDSDCKPVCGNGVLEAGELCDPGIASGAGSCPKSCNDNNVCTSDTPAGSACNVTCQFTPITQPQSNDGCCPPGANAANDNDCSASCGNGVLEPGEQCDTAIVSGAPGACPTTCDDQNACTIDSLSGSGCNATCVFAPITQPKDSDGCCPQGANSLNDNDCQPVCGNGALEAGETCDPKIAAGPGKCVEAADCDDQDPCTIDSVEGTGCDVRCEHTPATPDPQQQDGCCLPGHSKSKDADCLPACTPDRTQNCVDVCQHVACADGEYCAAGACLPWTAPEGDENPDGTASGQGATSSGMIHGGCALGSSAGQSALPAVVTLLLLLVVCRRRRS